MGQHMFGRRKQKDDSGIIARIRNGIFSTHADDDVAPNDRAERVNVIMLNIRQQALAAMPKFEEQYREQFAMDGADWATLGDSLAVPNMSENLLMWYGQQSFIQSQMCAIVGQHWLVNKACSMMPRDAIRKGFKIIGDDGNELSAKFAQRIGAYDKVYKLTHNLTQFVRKGRMFGIRVAVFKVDSPDPFYYEKPFNIDAVTPNSYRGIKMIDPYWTAPLLDMESAGDPFSLKFYEPTYWLVGRRKIHKSHCVVFINEEVADFLKPSYIYGGVPLPQMIMERIYAAERTANEGPMLAMSKRTTVLKVDAAKAFANKAKFNETLQWWIYNRDNNQVKVIDKDDEDMEQIETSLADLDKTIMNQYQLVSSIADTPSTRLLGTVPTGFNSTGDYEESIYSQACESVQSNDYKPMIERHHQLVIRSGLRDRSMRVEVVFNPMDAPTEAERAETNFKKAQTLKMFFDMGAIDAVDANEIARSDESLGMQSVTPAQREENDVDANGQPVRTIEDSPTPPDMFGAGSSDEPENDRDDSFTTRND
jgi:hypothetical protein